MIYSQYAILKYYKFIDDFSIKFLDKSNEISSEGTEFGGPRMMTFMIYLSDVEVGGNTIFIQPGISVQPVKGSALYWFNMGAQNNYDSRVFHLGCPVLYGNKWIANKWIKWFANHKTYPCLIEKHHFSVINH